MSAPANEPSQPRLSKRMTCALNVGARRYSGVVTNVSQGGLFVQTSAAPQRGTSVTLELNAPGEAEAIPVEAEVVWRRVVPQQLRDTAQGGMGMRILQANEHYYSALADWMRVEAQPAVRVPPVEPTVAECVPYRVRVRAEGGPRTRCVNVEAVSEEDAARVAREHAGDGWKVVEVDPV